jgi:WD40 repeat protein
VADQPETNPYVGPRPFELGETGLFFGREREQRELLSLVVAHRVVLLYAASGAGKTSLLNAALVPALEEEGFDVLPPARVRALSADEEVPTETNVYVFGLLTHLSEAEGGDLGDATIAAFLARREHPVGPDGYPAPRALIVDQLEELLTLHQGRWPEREGFFRQLAEAVRADPLLRIVLAIREDYLAQLDPYARLVPDRLRARIRLERLGAEAALKAATAPARHAGRSFAPGVAENLVGDLLQARVASASGETVGVEGEYVEPVHLQVTCHSLWSGLPPDATEITEEHRLVFGDVDQVLSQFYEETVAAAAARASMSPDALRERFEEAFITPLDTRGTVYWTPSATAGMPAAAVDEMDGRHLIRAELRAGARWYELTHDRLIGPVRASNRKRRAERAARRRRRQAQFGLATLAVGLVALIGAAITVLAGESESEVARGPSEQARAEARIAQRALRLSTLARTLRTHGGEIVQASFSPDAQEVLTLGLGEEGPLEIWDTLTGARRYTLPLGNTDFAYFTGEKRGARPVLFIATAGAFAQLLTTTGTTVATLPPNQHFLTARLTAKGFLAVIADPAGRAGLWRGGAMSPLRGSSGIVAADVSADGRFVATDTGFEIGVWSIPTARRIGTFALPPPREPSPLLSPNGRMVAAADARGRVHVWEAGRGKVGELPPTKESVGALGFSSDGQILVAAGDRVPRVLDIRRDRVFPLRGHTAAVKGVEVSAHELMAVTASDDGTARLWSLVSGKLVAILGGSRSPVTTASFSPDGRFVLTGGGDGTARVWGSVPDLKVTGVRARQVEGIVREVTGVVENVGNIASPATSVVARAGEAPESSLEVDPLQPGALVRFSLAVPRVPPSVFQIEVLVDPASRVRELSETNNAATVSVVPVTTEGPGQAAERKRNAIVAGALAGARQQGRIHYSPGPLRMDGVRRKIRLPALPSFEDTSSFVTWCYFQARAPDPNRRGYNATGNSLTLIDHGRRVSQPRRGDIVFYGSPGAIRYVGIYVGDDKVVAHRSEQGPRIQALRPASGPPFAFRSYVS